MLPPVGYTHARTAFFVYVMCGHGFSALWYLVVLIGISIFPWVGLCAVSSLGPFGTVRGPGDSQNAFHVSQQ